MKERGEPNSSPKHKYQNVEYSELKSRELQFFDMLQSIKIKRQKQRSSSQVTSQKRQLIVTYIKRVFSDPLLLSDPLEDIITNQILPKLGVIPYTIGNFMFYNIMPFNRLSSPFFYIFSENDIHSFYENGAFFSPSLSRPSKDEFLAIIYWHQNKIRNVTSLYSPYVIFCSPQILGIRTIALAFISAYWAQFLCPTPTHHHRTFEELQQATAAAYDLLRLPDPTFLFHGSTYQYILALISEIGTLISSTKYQTLLAVLQELSKENLSTLSEFHDMLATIYLGHAYTDVLTKKKHNVSVIYCRDILHTYTLVQSILNSTFAFSSKIQIHATFSPKVYTEYSISSLHMNMITSKPIFDDISGRIANISKRESKFDLELLKEVSDPNSHKEDNTFKRSYNSHIHYIYITDQPPPPLPKNFQLIKLSGIIPENKSSFSCQEAAILVLLSLFNFFHPTMPAMIPASAKFLSHEEAAEEFISLFFEDSTQSIPAHLLEEVKHEYHGIDLSKSEYDTERIKIGRKLGIYDLEYTTSQDVEEVYRIWRSSDPDQIPNIDVVKSMKQRYNELFYLKNNHAKSRLHPEEKEKNVKCFFGLALDKEKLTVMIGSDEGTAAKKRKKLAEESFTRYYENMIRNFQELQPEIQKALESMYRHVTPPSSSTV